MSDPVITRKGKIARLPSALREQVNQRLDDGQPGSVILPWLNGLKDVQEVLAAHFDGAAVNEQTLSDWRQGGFQDWLGRQDERKNIKRLTEYAVELVSDGKDPHDAANIIAAGRLLATIEEELTPSLIAQILAEKPGDMIGLIGSLVALQKERRQGVETRLSVEKFQRETAELFQKWYADARAKEIIESKATTSIKTEKLVQLIFGERPAAAAPAS